MKIYLHTKNNQIKFKTEMTTNSIKKHNNVSYDLKKQRVATSLTIVSMIALGALLYKNNTNKYLKDLAADLSKDLGINVKTTQLQSVMSAKEFLDISKTFKENNYIASQENIKNGTFIADFHSHSIFSDGHDSIQDILSKAAEYGDKLNKINGKKFFFAITDHDGVEGVKEALRIIVKNPEKYKNIKFVPAAELSFPMECQPGSKKFYTNFGNKVEFSEMLIYGINPFSKNSELYFSNLYKKRKSGIRKSLIIAEQNIPNIKFSQEELNKYFIHAGTDYCMLNQHWAVYHYLNLKTHITRLANTRKENPEKLFDTIMRDLINNGSQLNAEELNKYLHNNNLPQIVNLYPEEIENLKKEICPQLHNGIINAANESSFESIINYANKENAYLGFAHPVFTWRNIKETNLQTIIKKYLDNACGRIKFSEDFHQGYPEAEGVEKKEKEMLKNIMNNNGMISIGGQDKHSNNFDF